MSDVTRILTQVESSTETTAEQLLPLVYDGLRRLATFQMAQESPDHTLQPTALVHEAYVRLVDVEQGLSWELRGQFFASAAEAMRRILLEWARSKKRIKRGGDVRKQPIHDAGEIADESVFASPDRLIELDDALSKFEEEEPEVARLVRLRLFAGLSVTDAAQALGVSGSTAYDYWDYAVSWFTVELGHENNV